MFNKIGLNLLLVSVIALFITYIAAEQELPNSYLDDAPVNKGNFLQRNKRRVVIGRRNDLQGNFCSGGTCTYNPAADTGGKDGENYDDYDDERNDDYADEEQINPTGGSIGSKGKKSRGRPGRIGKG